MRLTSNLKVGDKTQQYSKSYKAHPMRTHIKIVKGKHLNKSLLKLYSNGWQVTDRQVINGKYYTEFHKRFKSDSNKNINPALHNYVVGTPYLKSLHNYLQFEKPTWLPYQTKRNKTQKRSRRVSFYDKMLYGKSKRKFTRDRRRYGRQLKRYHHKMVTYDQKIDKWKKTHPKYTTPQLNHFIHDNHPRKPNNPFGKRPLKSMIITIGNSEKRKQIHDLVYKKYKNYPIATRQRKLLKADLNYDLRAVQTFDKDLGPNAKVISFTTNPDEIGKIRKDGKLSSTAGANHIHLTIAFKSFTNGKKPKPSCNFNNYLKDRTNKSRPNQALRAFKAKVDGDIVKSTGDVLRRAFPKVKQFRHFSLLRTGLGNGTNLLMSKYKTRKAWADHYQQQINKVRHNYTIKQDRLARTTKTHESNYKYHTKLSLGNQLTSSADIVANNKITKAKSSISNSASSAITSNSIIADNSAQNAINNEWNDAHNSVSSTTIKLNTSASNRIASNSSATSTSASKAISSIADSLNTSANNKVSSISTSLNTSAVTDIASNSISADTSASNVVSSNSISASTTSSEFTIQFQSVSSKSANNASSASSLATVQSKLATQQNNMRKQQQAWHITETREQRKLKEQQKLIDKNKDVLNSINNKISKVKSIYYGFKAKIDTHKLQHNKSFINFRNELVQGFNDTLTKNQSINDRKLRQQRNNQAKHTNISKFKHGIDKLLGTTPQQRQIKSYKATYNQKRDTKLSNYWNVMSKWNHGKLPSNIQTTNYVDSLKNTVPETWHKHVKSISSAYGVGVLSYYQSVIPSLNTSNVSASRATNARNKKRMQQQKAIKSMHKSNQAQMATPADIRQEQIKSLGKDLSKSSKPTNTRTVPKITQSDITNYARNQGSGIGGR